MYHYLRTVFTSIALLVVALSAILAATPAQAQAARCFPENEMIRECIREQRGYKLEAEQAVS